MAGKKPILALACFLAMLATPVSPGAEPAHVHVISPGDTLFSIGRGYGVTVDALKRANGLSGDRIIAGRALVIPVPGPPAGSNDLPAKETNPGGLLETALDFLGVRYLLGGNDRRGIDCSGLVKAVFLEHGLNLPRTARDQFTAGEPVPRPDARPGDLFFYRNSRSTRPSHVGIYLGRDRLLHASRTARGVVISDMTRSPYYTDNFLGARRLVHSRAEDPES